MIIPHFGVSQLEKKEHSVAVVVSFTLRRNETNEFHVFCVCIVIGCAGAIGWWRVIFFIIDFVGEAEVTYNSVSCLFETRRNKTCCITVALPSIV